MYGTDESTMSDFRTEADSLGRVEVPAEKLWGAQTQRSLQHFSIGQGPDPSRDDHRLRDHKAAQLPRPTMRAAGYLIKLTR